MYIETLALQLERTAESLGYEDIAAKMREVCDLAQARRDAEAGPRAVPAPPRGQRGDG